MSSKPNKQTDKRDKDEQDHNPNKGRQPYQQGGKHQQQQHDQSGERMNRGGEPPRGGQQQR